MHRLHVETPVRLSHAALPGMVRRNSGGIINVSSIAAFICGPGNTSYCATKAWMNMFTTGLDLELRHMGSAVKVQALCPGYTYSGFHDVMGVDRSTIPKWLWMQADYVVERSLRGFDRGELIVVPNWKYSFFTRLVPLLPSGLMRTMAGIAAKRSARIPE
jgi:short-subunit dehydrogenase